MLGIDTQCKVRRLTLVKGLGQNNQAEPEVASPSFRFALEEAPHAEIQCLLAEHILVGSKLAAVKRAFASAVHLPKMIFLRLDEADVVQIHVFLGGGGSCVTASSSGLVGALESLGFIEQVGSLGWFQRYGILQQFIEI